MSSPSAKINHLPTQYRLCGQREVKGVSKGSFPGKDGGTKMGENATFSNARQV